MGRGPRPPGRCFRRVPPEPAGHNKACTPPLFTEGLPSQLPGDQSGPEGADDLRLGGDKQFEFQPVLQGLDDPVVFCDPAGEGNRLLETDAPHQAQDTIGDGIVQAADNDLLGLVIGD